MFDWDSLVWVTLPDKKNFLKVKETLARIGVASNKDHTLYQSCHIFHKQGHYAIVHFKEMFLIDGKQADLTEEDIARRNKIANLLDEWGLVELVDPKKTKNPEAPMNLIKVVKFDEKDKWNVVTKYSMGKKFKKNDEDDELVE